MRWSRPGVVRLLEESPVRLFAISAVLYLAAAMMIRSYLHPDHHFQTLEFANYKVNQTDTAGLPWEFEARMRPWTQPYLYVVMMEGLTAVGITSPFSHDLAMRLLSALLGLVSLVLFATLMFRWLPDVAQRRWLALTLALFWFFPVFNTSTGSENYSAAFMLLGLVSLWRFDAKYSDTGGKQVEPLAPGAEFSYRGLTLSGFCFGLMFDLRYQMGIVALAVFLWLLIRNRTSAARLTAWSMAGLAAVAGGLGLDAAGYGGLTLTPWNYLRANLLEGKAASFGVEPWYHYFSELASLPLGILLIAVALLFWFTRPGNILTWMSLPFFVVHMLLAHKEVRFLTPLAPLIIAMGVFVIPRTWFLEGRRGIPFVGRVGWHTALFYLFVAINGGALLGTFLSQMKRESGIQRYIYRHYPQEFEFYSFGQSPYFAGMMESRFYQPDRVIWHTVESREELELAVQRDSSVLFYHARNDLPRDDEWAWLREHCTLLYQNFGRFVQLFNVTDWLSRTFSRSLHRCTVSGTH